jgi:GxxExxY protein
MMVLLHERLLRSDFLGGAVGLIEHPTNPIIEDSLIVEIKSVDKLLPIHSAQLLTYMRLQRVSSGLLLNFNVHTLFHGIRRILR